MSTKTRFEKEAKGNSEMVYYISTSCDWLLNFAPPSQPFTFEQEKQEITFPRFPRVNMPSLLYNSLI